MEAETAVPAGVSWTWLAVYFSAAFLLDWTKSCFSYPSRPVAVRVLIAYYLLTYLLSLCSGLLSETVYQAELYFIYVLLGVDAMKGLRRQNYVSLLVYWQLFLGVILAFLHVSGLNLLAGWPESLVSWVLIPLTVLLFTGIIGSIACYFLFLSALSITALSESGRESYQTLQTSQEVGVFALRSFLLLFASVGLMLLVWVLIGAFGLLCGGVPWLVEVGYRAMWALLGAILASVVVERRTSEREDVQVSNFLATLISLDVLGGLASLAFE